MTRGLQKVTRTCPERFALNLSTREREREREREGERERDMNAQFFKVKYNHVK